MARLEGQVALVTGAGGGIGRATCAGFLREGANVLALDFNLEAAQDAVAAGGPKGMALACDVGDSAAVRAAVAAAVARFGKLTVLCNIAGGSSAADGSVIDAAEEEFWRVIRTDLFGTFLVCKHGIPELIRAGGGSVITMSSILARVGTPGRACYSAAKGGIISMTQAMAVEHGPQGVRVNAIAPGITLTPRVRKFIEEGRGTDLGTRHVVGLVEPEDIANMAVFLASDESRKITGQLYSVDSGACIA